MHDQARSEGALLQAGPPPSMLDCVQLFARLQGMGRHGRARRKTGAVRSFRGKGEQRGVTNREGGVRKGASVEPRTGPEMALGCLAPQRDSPAPVESVAAGEVHGATCISHRGPCASGPPGGLPRYCAAPNTRRLWSAAPTSSERASAPNRSECTPCRPREREVAPGGRGVGCARQRGPGERAATGGGLPSRELRRSAGGRGEFGAARPARKQRVVREGARPAPPSPPPHLLGHLLELLHHSPVLLDAVHTRVCAAGGGRNRA